MRNFAINCVRTVLWACALVAVTDILVDCGGNEFAGSTPPSSSKPKTHDIQQLGDDAGVPDAAVGDSSDPLDSARIAVAYCAAAVLDSMPKHCEVLRNGASLVTNCDTGLSITWNCDHCGDVDKNGAPLGHVLMTSDTRFEVTSPNTKQGYVCLLVGHEFTVEYLQ